ncbi:MAG: FtsW/RodA/SpoVE family cell cycle protein [Alistipes sp.]|nr:FtsW/RodA/SpoVE family cell cycle protein [Alistipes sp.]
MKEQENREREQELQDVPSILEKRRLLPGDRVLWVIVAMFFAISMVVVYSACSQLGFKDGSTAEYLQKHIMTLGLSAGILFGCYMLGARFMRRFTWIAYVVSWIMTLLPYFQPPINGAHRWLDLGFFMFQPSELLKIATIMLLAARLSALHHRIKQVRLLPSTFDVRKWGSGREREIILDEIIPVVSPIAFTCMVILPDATSSAVHIYVASLTLLFIAGIKLREILKLLGVSALMATIMLSVLVMFDADRLDTIKSRVMAWAGVQKESQGRVQSVMDKYTDSERSRMAIHNGGLFGVGAGRSVMRARLTHPESDYIFAIVVEEFGLLLAFVIVLLYLWLFFRALRIFEKCTWLYAGLLVVGLALLVTSQGFLHIGVNIGAIPETGQNLPFLTQGRTSMFCASIAVGVILSISRQVEQGTLVPPSQSAKDKEI